MTMMMSKAYADLIASHMDKITEDEAMVISFSNSKVDLNGRNGCEGKYKVLVEYLDRRNRQPIPYADGCWHVTSENNILMKLRGFDDGKDFQKTYTVSQLAKWPINKNVKWADYIVEQEKPDAKTQDQIKYIEQLNDKCRGGSGDDPATWQACDMREKAAEGLKSKGWCWGPDNAIGADKHWIRCPSETPQSTNQTSLDKTSGTNKTGSNINGAIKELSSQLDCEIEPNPGAIFRSMLADGIVEDTHNGTDGIALLTPKTNLSLYGYRITHIAGFQEEQNGQIEKPFWRTSWMVPPKHIAISLDAKPSDILYREKSKRKNDGSIVGPFSTIEKGSLDNTENGSTITCYANPEAAQESKQSSSPDAKNSKSTIKVIETKNGKAILSEEKCLSNKPGKHAFMPSLKILPKMGATGCWEEKDGYIYINWTNSIGADNSIIPIDLVERVDRP